MIRTIHSKSAPLVAFTLLLSLLVGSRALAQPQNPLSDSDACQIVRATMPTASHLFLNRTNPARGEAANQRFSVSGVQLTPTGFSFTLMYAKDIAFTYADIAPTTDAARAYSNGRVWLFLQSNNWYLEFPAHIPGAAPSAIATLVPPTTSALNPKARAIDRSLTQFSMALYRLVDLAHAQHPFDCSSPPPAASAQTPAPSAAATDAPSPQSSTGAVPAASATGQSVTSPAQGPASSPAQGAATSSTQGVTSPVQGAAKSSPGPNENAATNGKPLASPSSDNPSSTRQSAVSRAAALDAFKKQTAPWRAKAVKPAVSEEVTKKRLLAEDAMEHKNASAAIAYYEAGIALDPTWAAGWYSVAMLYADQQDYSHASDRMKHYLILLPRAANAAAAKDKTLLWEAKAEEAATK